MASTTTEPKPRRQHLTTVREAGFPRFSILSVVAGTLTAYGAFALVAALAGALLSAADVETEFRTNDWAGSGAVAGLVTAVVLLISYLFGGYVAGRMARRSGLLHGAAVFLLSLIAGAAAGAIVGGLSDSSDVERNLRSIGVPTTGDEWSAVSITAAVVAVAAMLVGALLGGLLGERWHTKLVRRAADPSYGPEADTDDAPAAGHDDQHGLPARDHADQPPQQGGDAANRGARSISRTHPPT